MFRNSVVVVVVVVFFFFFEGWRRVVCVELVKNKPAKEVQDCFSLLDFLIHSSSVVLLQKGDGGFK